MLIWATTTEEKTLLAAWAEERIEHLYGGELPPAVLGGVVRHGHLLAVVAFYNWQPVYRTLQVSVAAENKQWARPPVLRAIFEYAFEQQGANLLHGGTPSWKPEVVGFLKALGFTLEPALRHRYGPKKHMQTFSMTAAEWRRSRWFKELPK